MSVDFFGVGGPSQIGALKQSSRVQNDKKADSSGGDKVQFSAVLQDVNRARATENTGDSDRAERVRQLQAQVKDGSYAPDLNKVSASLLQFLVEGR